MSSTEFRPLRSHYPAFDGLRAVAAFMVFAVHYIYPVLPFKPLWWSFAGVDLFFVLSGFLITGILFDARHQSGFLKTFYKRRSLRIFPLFYAFWAAIFLLSPLLHPDLQRYNLSNLLYLGNFWASVSPDALDKMSLVPISVLGHHASICIGHFWSLCVEEHFYLLWPFIVWLFPSRKALLWISGSAVVAVLCLRIFLYLHNPVFVINTRLLYHSSYTRFDTMLIGSWFALWLRGASITHKSFKRLSLGLVSVPVVLLALTHLTIGRRWALNEVHPLLTTYGFTLLGLAAAGVLLYCIDEETPLFRILTWRQLAAFGRVSYGFYLFHMLPFDFFGDRRPFFEKYHATFLIPVIAFAATYACAKLSFRYLETPFLKLKDRARRTAPSVTPLELTVTHGMEEPA